MKVTIKISNQEDITKVVTGNKGVEYTLSKVYENKTRSWENTLLSSIKRLSGIMIPL